MTRSTKTQKALNLNAAHGLLSRGISVAEAATILAQERGISRAAGVSVFGARTDDYPCRTDWRSVGGGDVQDSARRADAIAFLLRAQWFDAECDRHPCAAEMFDDGAASAQQKWLSDRQSLLPSIWSLLSIACSQSSCSRPMGYW